MDDQDLINLQQLVGRDAQPWSLPPITPDHILYANVLAANGAVPSQATGPTPEQLMMADILRAHGQRNSTGDISDSDNVTPVGDDLPNSFGSPLGPLLVGRNDKKKECIERCSDLALPTGDYGVAFHRCVATCLGEADWPEWRKHFPNNRDDFPQPAPPGPVPQQGHLPWWLPLVPFLIRAAPVAAAAAA